MKPEASPRLNVDERIKELLILALHETKGNRTHACVLLGVSLRTVRNWVRKFDLKEPKQPRKSAP